MLPMSDDLNLRFVIMNRRSPRAIFIHTWEDDNDCDAGGSVLPRLAASILGSLFPVAALASDPPDRFREHGA